MEGESFSDDELSLDDISNIGLAKTPSKFLMSPPSAPLSGTKRPNSETVQTTPLPVKSSKTSELLSPDSMQSPPDATGVYNSRSNRGQVVTQFNKELGHAVTDKDTNRRCEVRLYNREGEESTHVEARYRFMYTGLEERARAFEQILLSFQEQMSERLKELNQELSPVGEPRQESVWITGRILCEAAEGKLNPASVLLEGSRKDSGGSRVELDLRNLKSFALFPGQVIAVEGVNSSGRRMVVSRIAEGIPRPLASTPVESVLDYNYGKTCLNGKPLSIMVAAGPFTTSDNLHYEPLRDLLGQVNQNNSDVLILIGPFLDAEHPEFASGEPKLQGEGDSLVTADYYTVFVYRVASLLSEFFKINSRAQVVLVPSIRDIHHDFVYPQAPFTDKIPKGLECPWTKEFYGMLEIPSTRGLEKRVHCVPNPCTLSVNEITIGITSNDILFDISSESIHVNTGNRRVRLAEHLLRAQNCYPLFPSNPNSTTPVDFRQSAKWKMPVTPDILLVPSKLAYFAKTSQDCLCINPGYITKGISAGTYAQITVHPNPRAELEKLTQGPTSSIAFGKIRQRASVDIKRI